MSAAAANRSTSSRRQPHHVNLKHRRIGRVDVRAFLRSTGLPDGDLHDLPDSDKRFPDGAQYRVEIPSTEGPRCLEAVLDEAARLDVRVHRVSQGSGVFMQTDARARRDGRASRARRRVEVSLFARPNAAWGLSATARAHGGVRGRRRTARSRSSRTSRIALRAAEHGFRSVLIADLGVLDLFREARDGGPAAARDAGQGLGDAARREPGRGTRARAARRLDDQPPDRSDAGRRSPRSARRSTSRSTCTSRRPTTSAASCATTRSRS